MQRIDLRTQPPRRWNVDIDGIRWLPRLIDKARAAGTDMLGDYLFGQSPMDHGLLRVLALSHRGFFTIVSAAADDRAVLAGLEAASPGALDRARAWSTQLPRRHALFLFLIDVDDGYLGGGWGVLKAPANAVSALITRIAKRVWPSRAAKPEAP